MSFSKVVVLILSLMTVIAQAETKKVLRVVADTWKPMTGRHLPYQGFSIHLARLAFKELGYELSVEFMPWTRIDETINKDRYDIITAVWSDRNRALSMEYSEPYYSNNMVFISKSSEPFHYAGPNSLLEKRLGLVSAYSYPEEVLGLKGVDYQLVSDARQNLQRVASGEIDITLGAKSVMAFQAKTILKKGEALFYDDKHPVANFPLYLALSKRVENHQDLIQGFNQIMIRYKQQGIFEQLERQHGLRE